MEISDYIIGFFTHPWFIFSLVFWVIFLALFYILRKKKNAVLVFFPFIAMLRTKRLNRLINKLGRKAPRFWKIFWTIGIFVSVGFTIFGLYFFTYNLIILIIQPRPENAVSPLIPGVTIELSFFIEYLIIPILIVMTTHELAHGIAASAEDVEVQSTGIMGAGLFYLIGLGAFVEVDERQLNSSKFHRNTRLRIAAAGTYVNAMTAGIALLFLLNFSLLASPCYGPQVTQIDTVLTQAEGGFNKNNLAPGDVIVAMKNKGAPLDDYLYLKGEEGITLTSILDNETSLKCTVGTELTLKIYNPTRDNYTEKDILLGPRYNLGITYEYISNTQLEITYVYNDTTYGVNNDKNLREGMTITKVNGENIDVELGKTLERHLSTFNVKQIILTDDQGNDFLLDIDVIGVFIGVQSKNYWLPKNSIAKLFTGTFPEFVFLELFWLWVVAFSLTLFNMMPVPAFDGDRMIKEFVSWGIGENFSETRKKKDRFYFDKDEKDYGLSEYRINKIEDIKIILSEKSSILKSERKNEIKSEILLDKSNYDLIDKIGDGFRSTIHFNFPENVNLDKQSIIEVNYEYVDDRKRESKHKILWGVRIYSIGIVVLNFILSYVKLGVITFWM